MRHESINRTLAGGFNRNDEHLKLIALDSNESLLKLLE